MALPELPAQGQDPWYTTRTNFDESLRAELEVRLSEQAINDNISQMTGIIPAAAFGVGTGTPAQQLASLHAAFAHAESLGGGLTIMLPPGGCTITGGFKLAGYSSGLVGSGTSAEFLGGSGPTAEWEAQGSVIRVVNQSGPALDFTGFRYPANQINKSRFENFTVKGDGVANPANKGIYLFAGPEATPLIDGSSVIFNNVNVFNTGGPGLHVRRWYLSDFYGVTVCNPVGVVENNVPYVLLEEDNGNRYFGLGLRALIFGEAASVGAGGALVSRRTGLDGDHYPYETVFYGLWLENLWASNGATLIHSETTSHIYSDTQFFDIYKTPGATGTSYFRFNPDSKQPEAAGNIVRGVIPAGAVAASALDIGIELNQSGNRIEGIKSQGGNHVRLSPGVNASYVHLGGAYVRSAAAAFQDNSGTSTNTLLDDVAGLRIYGAYTNLAPRHYAAGILQSRGVLSQTLATGSAAPRFDLGYNVMMITATGNIGIGAPSAASLAVMKPGEPLEVVINQDATGGRTVTWNAVYQEVTAPSPTPNASTAYRFIWTGTVFARIH